MVYAPHQEPSAPPMYPSDNIRPVPPVRSEFNQDPLQQTLLQSPPRVPDRYDKPSRSNAEVVSRTVNTIEIFFNELIA